MEIFFNLWRLDELYSLVLNHAIFSPLTWPPTCTTHTTKRQSGAPVHFGPQITRKKKKKKKERRQLRPRPYVLVPAVFCHYPLHSNNTCPCP